MYRTARCFYVVSELNGRVLDVRGAEATAGAGLIVFDRKPLLAANQLWYEDEAGLLRSKLNGYVIDTSGDCRSSFRYKSVDISRILHYNRSGHPMDRLSARTHLAIDVGESIKNV